MRITLIGLGLGLLALVAAGSCAKDDAPRSAATAPEATRPLAPSGRPYSEERAACADRTPLRRPLWGELHVHSDLSMDAWLWDVRGTPDDVFAFAKGEPGFFPPIDADGQGTRRAVLDRPLDFVSLTDHASFQGEVALCTRPGSPRYDSLPCRTYRGEVDAGDSPFGAFGARLGALAGGVITTDVAPGRSEELCGDLETCRRSMRSVWDEQRDAAERHYDRSASCRFTTLHGYEYTATPAGAKVHHNVIFRNDKVLDAPIAWVDEPDEYEMWRRLKAECIDAGTGCDVLTLPHNSNLSNGRMFVVTGRDLPIERQRARARLRAELEPLVEISQIKGDSECRNGMYQVLGMPDEFCDYEKIRAPDTPDCEEGSSFGALGGQGCISRTDFVRYALLEGLRERERIGVNPYKLGILAATDAHNANPGDVDEYDYQGWRGVDDDTPAERLSLVAGQPIASGALMNPGGLAAVWAEENSRDAIFDALKRRETFGTSGPRITARFFGAWSFDPNLCDEQDLVREGYGGGVPMGGELPARPAGAEAPVFVVSALRDVGTASHPGTQLQRAQIVKGWVDADGAFHQAIYDVAGGANGASVDTATCDTRGPGSDSLCAVWRDPRFDPADRAVYYVRVLENPTCRWTQHECLRLPLEERPPACSDPSVPKTIQERLWTSPIWYDGA